MKTHTTVFTSADELAEKTAEKIISIGHQAISMHGHFSWSLAGGKTPKMVYEVLAKNRREFAIQFGTHTSRPAAAAQTPVRSSATTR